MQPAEKYVAVAHSDYYIYLVSEEIANQDTYITDVGEYAE